MYNDDFLNKRLIERKQQNAFRQLRLNEGKIDFCSNDYLGIVKNNLLNKDGVLTNQFLKTGSTGSRLLSGNYILIEETEKEIALFHQSKAALIFNSGYDANVGILSCVPQKGDVVIYDALSHASIRDGIHLSHAQSFSFTHNELNDLEKKLQHAITIVGSKNIFVVTESVFSMDGDVCPLQELIALCKRYNAHIILDEAHATGVIGERGEGLAQSMYLQDEIFCRVHTFGKACGCHGAVVLGSQHLKEYLVNFARSFIYSTALPEHAIAAIQKTYQTFPALNDERKKLQMLVQMFQSSEISFQKLPSKTPIQIVVIPGNEEVKTVAETLQQKGFDVRAVLYPSVPKGKERLRIVLHAFNTEEEVTGLINALKK